MTPLKYGTQKKGKPIKGMDKSALKIPHSGVLNKHTNKLEPKSKDINLERIKKQARRLTAILQLEECICYKGNAGARWLQDVKEQLANLRAKFKEDTDKQNPKEKETLNKLNDPNANRTRKIIDVKKARLDYNKIIHQTEANIIKKIRNSQDNTYVGLASHGQTSKNTRKGKCSNPSKSLRFRNGRNDHC